MAGMMLVSAPLSGRLVGSRGPRPSLVAAGAGLVVAAAMLTQLQAGTPIAYVLAAYALFGLGLGLVNPPITNTAVSGMPAAQAGVAAAVASTSRQVGLTLGVAMAGAVAGGSAWWAILGVAAAVLLLGALSTSHWADVTARRTADALAHA
jgi:predicted MFS family arabinose efflux permease